MLSVIVPIYNSEKYISKCIESLIHQEYKNLEIILVDDGSTDSSYDICKSYAQIDQRIQLHQKENAGPASAKNLGLQYAKGEYITFVDSDDEIRSDTYSSNIGVLEQHPEIEILQFPCILHYQSENEHKFEPQPNLLNSNEEVLKNWLITKNINWIVCNKIFKRNLLTNQYFPSEMLFEDNYLLAIILNKINHLNISDQGCYFYYYRENSITNSANSLKKEDSLRKVNIKVLDLILDHKFLSPLELVYIDRILHNTISLKSNFKHKEDYSELEDTLKGISLKPILSTSIPFKTKLKIILAKFIGVEALLKFY